jgi:tetratricopeptide (TPR) repeat protein
MSEPSDPASASDATLAPEEAEATFKQASVRGTAVGRYLLLERLGSGGMGIVYAAYDPSLDRKVALKFLRYAASGTARDLEHRERLLREGKAMARLNHPNVIAVHDVGAWSRRLFIAIELRERTFGAKDPRLFDFLQNLCVVLLDLGRFEEWLEKQRRLLTLMEEVSGPTHNRLAGALVTYSRTLLVLGRYREALAAGERGPAIRTQLQGERGLAASRIYLAGVHEALGDYRRAEAAVRSALPVLEGRLRTRQLVHAFERLGSVLRKEGRLREALSYYERGLALNRKYFPQSDLVGWSELGLGETTLDLGDRAAARRHFEEAQRVFERVHKKDHYSAALAQARLGALAKRSGDMTAPRLLASARDLLERRLGRDHPAVAEVLIDEGTAEALRRAIEILERTRGDPRPLERARRTLTVAGRAP